MSRLDPVVDEVRTAVLASPFADLAGPLTRSVEPCVCLRMVGFDDEPEIGGSRLRGLPDLARPWPRRHGVPLTFLGQVRLEDVAPLDERRRLPPAGLLSFFYDCADAPSGGKASHAGAWVARFEPPGAPLARAEFPEDGDEEHFEETALLVKPHLLRLYRSSILFSEVAGTSRVDEAARLDDQIEAILRRHDQADLENTDAFLLGTEMDVFMINTGPAWTSNETFRLAHPEAPPGNLVDLLTVHTFFNFVEGVRFFIHEADLAAARFDRLWGEIGFS